MIDFMRMRWLIRQESELSWKYEKELSKASKRTAGFSESAGSIRGYKSGSKVEEGGIMLAIISEELDRIRDMLMDQRKELLTEMECLEDPNQRMIIKLRYIQGVGPRVIARTINYSESHVFRMLNKAERAIISEGAKQT